ncbi:hypothetical protein BSKO_08925 [Bryopsis sp. KO-2023]|nr:hypothetical protein BSKO_08925 [Bryopsis sp. KO-2023]
MHNSLHEVDGTAFASHRIALTLHELVLQVAEKEGTKDGSVRLNITSGSIGSIEIAAVTEGGIMHCTPATLLAVPQDIADELGQLAQRGAQELRLQRRNSEGRVDGDVNALVIHSRPNF